MKFCNHNFHMKCKLSFDYLSGYIVQTIFLSLVTLSASFLSDWKNWRITCVTIFSLQACLYCILMAYDEKPKLLIDEAGVTIRRQLWLFSDPILLSWSTIVSYDEYSDKLYNLSDELPPSFLIIKNIDSRTVKINLSRLDHQKDEILHAMKKYSTKSI